MSDSWSTPSGAEHEGPAPIEVEILTREQCLALLRHEGVGRLAVLVDRQPEIYPVNYVMDGDRVVYRSSDGTKLDHASFHPVAFEIDHVDTDAGQAWSVVVKGSSRELTTALDGASERERRLPLEPIGTRDGTHWLRIIPRQITGRCIRRPTS